MRKYLVIGALLTAAIAQETPIIRVTTQLVQVNVVVRDKNGPVKGLTKEDFELLDRGKPQKIALFQVSAEPGTVSQTPKLPPNLFTNRLPGAEVLPNATAILIDAVNTPVPDQDFARAEILKLLRSRNRPDRMAIFVLGSGLRVLQDFTDDQERLIQAASGFQARVPREAQASAQQTKTGNSTHDKVLNTNFEHLMHPYFKESRMSLALEAIELISDRMAPVSGRKSLIWISAAFPLWNDMDPKKIPGADLNPRPSAGSTNASAAPPPPTPLPQSFVEQSERTARSLNRSGVAIYPVDPRGLVGLPEERASQPRAGVRMETLKPQLVSYQPEGIEAMKLLAEGTGGKAFYGSNDVGDAIRKAMDDAQVTYTLGFYPDEKSLDRKFHDLRVKVNRPGADVRYRKIYFAGEPAPPTEKEVQTSLRDAAQRAIDASGIGIAAQLNPTGKPGAYQLTIGFELADLALDHRDGRWKGAADLVIVQLSADGRTLDLISDALSFDMPEPSYRARLKDGVSIAKAIVAKPGLANIRVLVADRKTGNLGSLRVLPPKP